MRTSRIIRTIAAAALVAGATSGLAVAGVAAPASAAGQDILVSSDGIHWSTSLNADLFAATGSLIPKGSQSATLWVKNPTANPAQVRLSARDVTFSSPDISGNVTVGSWNSIDESTLSMTGNKIAKCQVLVNSQPLAAGAVMKAVVTFALGDITGQVAQDAKIGMNVMVAMRDEAAGSFPASACHDDGIVVGPTTGGNGTTTATGTGKVKPLAETGADAATPLLAGAGLAGGGLLFFLIGRRRRKSDKS